MYVLTEKMLVQHISQRKPLRQNQDQTHWSTLYISTDTKNHKLVPYSQWDIWGFAD